MSKDIYVDSEFGALRIGRIPDRAPLSSSGLLCLFVGGPHDGERMRVRSLDIIRLYKYTDADQLLETSYHRETIRTSDGDLVLYRHETITVKQAITALMDAYRHNQPGEP